MTSAASSRGAPSASVGWDGGELVITRVFAAPREVVFRAWTEPEHFARWFGPRGTTLPFLEMDVRPGGDFHFCHRHASIGDVWVRGVYDEVRAPERIAFTDWFSDEAGNRVERPGFPPEMRVTVTFAERDGGTEVTIRHAGLVADQGEVQGWIETLDRLNELVTGLA